ncbi:MAG: tetratricopeptide repeat protein [Bacteroidota bacterium]
MSKKKSVSPTSSSQLNFKSSRLHLILILFTCFLFYGNSIPNDTALDDIMVLTNNQFVLKGIEGIPDIITHESFFGATGKISAQLSWRYRPLSLIIFAIEHSFFGNNWSAYHFMNVLIYTLLCISIYYFLKRILINSSSIYALVATLLFAIHPMHTEVVANIKSLDEILALLFSILFLNSIITVTKKNNRFELVKSIFYLLFALLSKESSSILLLLAPLTYLVFTKLSLKEIILKSIPFASVVIAYSFFRLSISDIPVSTIDIMNDPYLLATTQQKFATIFLILGKYLFLLFVPITQCIDYGFNQIPYVDFTHPATILSLTIYVGLSAYGVYCLVKRNPSGLFISSYLISIVLLSNAFVNVGPPMADRFLFAPSFFFIAFLMYLVIQISTKVSEKTFQYTSGSLLALFFVFSFIKVTARNADWKNNETLYQADINKSPNSVRMLSYHGGMLVTQTDSIQDSIQKSTILKLAVTDFEKAYSIYPSYSSMFQNWGVAYYRLNNLDSTEWAWNKLKQLKPDSKFIASNNYLLATARFNIWNKKYEAALPRQNFPELLALYSKAMTYYDAMPGSWVLLGQLYTVNNKKDSATWAWNECLKRDSTNEQAKKLLANPVW